MNWVSWALLGALFAGVTAVLAKAGVADLNSHLATAIRTTVMLVFAWAVAAVSLGGARWPSVAPREWLFLVLSGLAGGLSWICYFRALQLGAVSRVAPVDKLSVAIAILLGVVFLGERLSPREICGAALMVAGVVVLVWK